MLFKLIIAKLGLWKRGLKKELSGELTEEFLELLLKGMDVAFLLWGDYRKNIEDFQGRYLFKTKEGPVAIAAIFENGDMKVKKDEIDDWDVRITFKNPAALRDLLFSQDQDILNAILKNEVSIDGNQNYIYKFGFMARDLGKRLGLV